METTKINKSKWVVTNGNGNELFTAKTKKACEQFIADSPVEETTPEKAAKPEKPKKNTKRSEIVAALNKFVGEGRYTRKELIDLIQGEVNGAKLSTVGTYLSDCKNPKYNPLEKLVTVNDKGIFQFTK